MPPCSSLSIKRDGSRVKWSKPWNGVASSTATRCSSNRKTSFQVALDFGRQICFTYMTINIYSRLYIYIYMCVCVCVCTCEEGIYVMTSTGLMMNESIYFEARYPFCRENLSR